ncbi:hypothetical protein ACWN6Y_05450 [Vagococcus teuberi]|uniref:Uncharacterized protein n=1 Tax=Vagococcus teuberi TaxID=519472 RepID=A0A1J0A829_9ENTE|nr:hypothetical protein [Vagococcus teuberi]APB32100.1 hypothetical protein BHY08_09940 [Vagococcus teuberi]
MTNYEKKEDKVIDDVVKVLNELDANLDKLDQVETDPKNHSVRKWYYESKALHNIKRILHDIEKYEKYDEKEFEKIEKEFEKYGL